MLLLLILITANETDEQTLSPRLVHYTQLSHGRLIVISVMETAHTALVLLIYMRFKIMNLGIHLIIVVRIILISIQ